MDITYLLIGCFIFCSTRTSAQDENWELVWEDNFDFLDYTKWDYEVTAWGGGVSKIWEIHVTSPHWTKKKRINKLIITMI